MVPFLKKDILQLKNDRIALVLMLIMPLILIVILGFALSNAFRGVPDDIKIAIIDQDSLESDLDILQERLTNELPPDVVKQLVSLAPDVSVPDLFIKEVLQDESLQESIELEFVNDIEAARNEKEFAAVIVIPNEYRLSMWEQLFFGESNEHVDITLFKNSEESLRANIVESLVDHFFYEMQVQTILNRHDLQKMRKELTPESVVVQRGVESITSFEYYTIGMSVMFVLFTAGIMANYAVEEKKTHVFGRMLLANISRGKYLLSKWVTTTILAFMQMVLLFIVTSIFFAVQWHNLTGIFLITLALSIAVGGISVLLTTVNFSLNSDKASNVFQMVLISILAFVGGSMVPLKEMSPMLGMIGDLTPNGRAMTGYLHIMQGNDVSGVINTIIILGFIGIACFVIAAILFPRKGALS